MRIDPCRGCGEMVDIASDHKPDCPWIAPDHVPCCSSHGITMSCERYRLTHFVEVRPCCSKDADRLRQEKRNQTFDFGQRVRFSNPLTRRTVYPAKAVEVVEDWFGKPRTTTRHINREWQPNQWAGEKEGMVIGKRTISDGYAEYDDEYGTSYSRAVNHIAYLVVADMKSKPVLVRPEDITVVES